jgi:hypothetical protein
MKKLALSLMCALSTLLLGGSALAQSIHVRATIPFEFTVNTSTLPAGTYDVVSGQGTNQDLWRIGCVGGPTIFVRISDLETRTPSANSKLVFHRYGSMYFLSQLMTEGTRLAWKFPKARAESQLAKNGAAEEIMLAAEFGQ